VGYDNPIGYLKGGFETWKAAGEDVDTIEEVEADEFVALYNKEKVNLLDVRKNSEFSTQHIEGAVNYPLDFINKQQPLERDQKYYMHCASGYRSVIAASILKSRGIEQVVNIRDGFKAMATMDIALTDVQEQITEL
jgi:rhodanese-related sulfurtransferase